MALSLLESLKIVANWVKGVADYPISIERLSDTAHWKDRTLTKYKSGRMVFEGIRPSISMNYAANGNAYIDYFTFEFRRWSYA